MSVKAIGPSDKLPGQPIFQLQQDQESFSENYISTKCPPMELRHSWNLAWKFLFFYGGTWKQECVSRSTQNHSSPQTTNCGQDYGNTWQHAATGHVELPKFSLSHCFQARLQECLHFNGGHLVNIELKMVFSYLFNFFVSSYFWTLNKLTIFL